MNENLKAVIEKEIKKIEKAADRIIIMPGSGVRANNIKQLAEYTGAIEMHSSARTLSDSLMSLNKISMNENLKAVSVDEEEIREMLS
jgi:copper homeostasis protein